MPVVHRRPIYRHLLGFLKVPMWPGGTWVSVSSQAWWLLGLVALCQGGRMGPSLRTTVRHNDHDIISWGCYEQESSLPTVTRRHFPFCRVLQDNTTILYWTPDRMKGDGQGVTLAVVSRLSLQPGQWMALGLSSESGGMRGLDVAMLWAAEDGAFYLEDRWARDYTVPTLDTDKGTDKVLLASHSRPSLPLTAFVLSLPDVSSSCRNASAGDCEDVVLSPRASTFISFAHGGSKPGGTSANGTRAERRIPTYHGLEARLGGVAVALLAPPETQQTVRLPHDAVAFSVQLPSVPVPPHPKTSYVCMWVQPPQDRKYHIYSVRLVGDVSVQRRVMHHAILYGTQGTTMGRENETETQTRPPLNTPYDCTEGVGSDAVGLPILVASHTSLTSPPDEVYEAAEAAIPFGKGTRGHDQWMLEVHYENTGAEEGLLDSTGFELVYSPTLRRHDAAVLVTGAAPSNNNLLLPSTLAIPPGLSSYDHISVCPSNATRAIFNNTSAAGQGKEGLSNVLKGEEIVSRVLYARLHMHNLGTGGEIQVERGEGKVVDTVLRRDYWDFHNQQGVWFVQNGSHSPPVIAPGDTIRVRCSYNSTDRKTVTRLVTSRYSPCSNLLVRAADGRWGPSGEEEMCAAYLYIAPAPPGGDTVCTS